MISKVSKCIIGALFIVILSSCIINSTLSKREKGCFGEFWKSISLETNCRNIKPQNSIVEINVSDSAYYYFNKEYKIITFNNFNNYKPEDELIELVAFCNDTIFILNAKMNTYDKVINPINENCFITFNSMNETNYISTSILGSESQLVNKVFETELLDTVYTFSINYDVSNTPYISEFSLSKRYGIISLKYFNGDFVCSYH